MAATNETPADKVVLRLQDIDGHMCDLGVKHDTKLGKVLNYYAKSRGRDAHLMRLLYDGTKLDLDKTVGSLDLDEEDEHVILDVVMEQTGGGAGA